MNNLDLIIEAIDRLKPISFDYDKKGEISRGRIGNPYAVFIFTAKNTKIQSTKVHIVQTDGPSESGEYNNFRTFNLEDIDNITVLKNNSCFGPPFHPNYNPEWDGYKDIIAKV